MRLLPGLVALFFTVVAEAQNFSSYVPDCAPPCVQQTLDTTKLCASLDDNKCLCTNVSQILFPSIACFSQTCNNSNLQALRCMRRMHPVSLTSIFRVLKDAYSIAVNVAQRTNTRSQQKSYPDGRNSATTRERRPVSRRASIPSVRGAHSRVRL